jgi:hypothetical protein
LGKEWDDSTITKVNDGRGFNNGINGSLCAFSVREFRGRMERIMSELMRKYGKNV